MLVRDIMTSPARFTWHDAPVESAAELMTTYDVTALPVLGADGRLVGVVSDGDLLWHRVPAEPGADPGRHPDTEPTFRPGTVVEVMSEYPVTTTPGADVADAAQLMLDHDVRSLPVVDGGAVVGIVSRRDILKAMVRDDLTLTAEVQVRLDDYAGRAGLWLAEVHAGVAVITGHYPNEQQRRVVAELARIVPGVAAVRLCPNPQTGTSGPATRSHQVVAQG
ncbi:CBS domain-containing protein [Actinoplanes campanulatus]|uniref:CBS domain-containing protein n=1 Tax=Actinoplanes campanulatus TaxID=113559 RepID=A0A7W5ARU7_9ACTN|nr:CBS domain-containing protein [Actinoplanes campanulatus]MBB3101092.1 CBS domain-containing protein [Actinoplanes campanulatus]GGN51794.1 CBS domain-containing protein [Actinoplanes campanulatus]GID42047.1 CBS domain-containing protein [Actinoplanes campanulatus]